MKIVWIASCAAFVAVAPAALCDNRDADNATSQPAKVAVTTGSITAPSPAYFISAEISRPTKAAGVPNFGKLNNNIWRSGQPTKEGYKLLASQGLKTVVNLRSEFPQDSELIPTGVKYVYIPIRDEHAPTAEQAEQFMKVASDPANWPLLVHCHAGEGRAGTMAALVRCDLDKWNDNQVMKETSAFRSAHILGIKTAMAGCQRKFIQDWEARVTTAQPTVEKDKAKETAAAPVAVTDASVSQPGS